MASVLNQALVDLISEQIKQRHVSELRAVLSTGNEITMHAGVHGRPRLHNLSDGEG